VFAMNFSAPIASQRFWYALGCVSGAVLVILAALWLEYLCRLTGENDGGNPPVRRDDDGDWVLPSTQPRRKPGA